MFKQLFGLLLLLLYLFLNIKRYFIFEVFKFTRNFRLKLYLYHQKEKNAQVIFNSKLSQKFFIIFN